jgi:hypothetical protein
MVLGNLICHKRKSLSRVGFVRELKDRIRGRLMCGLQVGSLKIVLRWTESRVVREFWFEVEWDDIGVEGE